MTSTCIICSLDFPSDQIEQHTNLCLDGQSGSAPSSRQSSGFVDLTNDAISKQNLSDEAFAKQLQQEEQQKASKSLIQCQRCTEKVEIDKLFILDDCSHKFCRSCIKQYVLENISINVKIACPLKDCPIAMSVRDVQELVPNKGKMLKPKGFSADASKRLIAELQHISESDPEKNGFSVEPIDDNLYEWEIKLFGFSKDDGDFYKDLQKVKGKAITLKAVFPPDYPYSPPFIRVIRPRFAFRTGHITIGGSICFELLTRSGWSVFNTLESVIVSLRANLVLGKARLAPGRQPDYTESEAKIAFDRMCREHGW